MRFILLMALMSLISCEQFPTIEYNNTVTQSKSKCDEEPNPSSLGFQDGDGLTKSTPLEICTAEQLNSIGDDPNLINKHYALMSDIDLSGVTFKMIGNPSGNQFSGSMNGNNHTISNLTINEHLLPSVGFIRSNMGEVKNLKLKNINIIGDRSVGGLVAENHAKIIDCSVSGSVQGSGYLSGGLAALNTGNIIRSYAADMSAAGYEGVGLLVGNNEGSISQSYAIGKINCDVISCSGDVYGGLAGYMTSGTISQSYAVGNLDDVPVTLGYGLATAGAGSVTDSFWDKDVYPNSELSSGVGATTSEMKSQTFYEAAGWDFATVWKIDPSKNNGYPELR